MTRLRFLVRLSPRSKLWMYFFWQVLTLFHLVRLKMKIRIYLELFTYQFRFLRLFDVFFLVNNIGFRFRFTLILNDIVHKMKKVMVVRLKTFF